MLFFLLAISLFPLAVYCTVLGTINRRMQPLVVGGSSDFLGVLFATSGFLLIAGPTMLSTSFQQSMRELPFANDSKSIAGAAADVWASWWVLWLLYYLFVVGGAAVLVWARRNALVIYNIDMPQFESALASAARRLDMEVKRLGNRLFLAVVSGPAPLVPETEAPTEVMVRPRTNAQPPLREPREQVVVDVEPFAFLCNVSLHWQPCSPEARADVERELRKALAEVATAENAAGAWLLGIAAFLFLAIVMLTAVYVLSALFPPRR